MTKPADKIIAGLNDAIAFAQGDSTKGRIANLDQRLAHVAKLAGETASVAGQQVASILADTERALKRAAKRAESLPEEWDRQEIKPHAGPTIEFHGRLLAETKWVTTGRDPLDCAMEIWETRAGALIAVFASIPVDRDGFECVQVKVVEPSEDAQAMRLAVMEHFEFDNRARSMARKLGWDLRVEVE